MGSEEFVETREAGEGEHGFDYVVVILLVSGQTNACVDLSCWNSSRLVCMISSCFSRLLPARVDSQRVCGNFPSWQFFIVFPSLRVYLRYLRWRSPA